MSLHLLCSRLPLPSPHRFSSTAAAATIFCIFLTGSNGASYSRSHRYSTLFLSGNGNVFRRSVSSNESIRSEKDFGSELLDEELLNRVSVAKDAAEALFVIAEGCDKSSGVVSTSDSCLIISAAIDRSNADLALSIFFAMRTSFGSG